MALQSMTALANITLQSASSQVTFSSIPQNYRDLVLVFDGRITDTDRLACFRFNNDSGSNYTTVYTANTASATRSTTAADFYYQASSNLSDGIIQIMDYSATDKHKTIISRSNNPSDYVFTYANRWANTAAITSITFLPMATNFTASSTFVSGSIFSLYGRIA
jgi:hypothetical protein